MLHDTDSQLTDARDAEMAAYRPLSKLAVVGLIWGLFALTALVDPLMWLIPILGIVINGLALWRLIRFTPQLLGRKVALIGLMLSILLGFAAPINWYGHRFMLDREARQVAGVWFEFLCRGEAQAAHQLTIHPDHRQPLDGGLAQFYKQSDHWQGELDVYRQTPLIHFLERSGENAQCRYYQTNGFGHRPRQQVVYAVWVVTYDDDGEKKSFFVKLELARASLDSGQADWVVSRATGGGFPPGW